MNPTSNLKRSIKYHFVLKFYLLYAVVLCSLISAIYSQEAKSLIILIVEGLFLEGYTVLNEETEIRFDESNRITLKARCCLEITPFFKSFLGSMSEFGGRHDLLKA